MVSEQVWTCAPRFQRPKEKYWPPPKNVTEDYLMMLGQCFIFSSDDAFQSNSHIIPLEERQVFFGRQGVGNEYGYGTLYAQAGMALHSAEEDVLIGAPGAWNWTGTLVA